MADTTFRTTLPPLRAIDNGDGTYSVATSAEKGTGQTPVGVNVTTSSTEILAANDNRKHAIVVNDSDAAMWLAIGQAAEAHKGIRLNARGGSLVIGKRTDLFSVQAINGIHESVGNKVACAQEFE